MTSCGKRCARDEGFSLVEVIVSLFLIVLVLAGAYRMIISASQLSRTARNHYIAETLCKNRLERARNFDYRDLDLLEESSSVVDDAGYPDPSGWFSRTTTVDTNFLPDCTQVSVVIQLKDRTTGNFGPAEQNLDMLFTEYLVPPVP